MHAVRGARARVGWNGSQAINCFCRAWCKSSYMLPQRLKYNVRNRRMGKMTNVYKEFKKVSGVNFLNLIIPWVIFYVNLFFDGTYLQHKKGLSHNYAANVVLYSYTWNSVQYFIRLCGPNSPHRNRFAYMEHSCYFC